MEATDNMLIEYIGKKQIDKEIPSEKLSESATSYVVENKMNQTAEILSDEFEHQIAASMNDLDSLREDQLVIDTTDTESDIDSSPLKTRTKPKKVRKNVRDRTQSSSSDSTSEGEDEVVTIGQVIPYRLQGEFGPPHLPHMFRPLLMPFIERRRLSQCKEESEEESDRNEKPEKVEKVSMLAQCPNTIVNSTQVPGQKRKFIVTKTELEKEEILPEKAIIRPEAEVALRHVTQRQNAATIHFPCSSANDQRISVQSLFSPQGPLNPHLDKRYFDTSLVEVRTFTDSTKSLNPVTGERKLDDVWIPRENQTKKRSTVSVVIQNY